MNSVNGTPGLFNGSVDSGLNIWGWSSESIVSFDTTITAFVGTATWSVGAADYARMLAANTVGDIYFPASTDAEINGGPILQGVEPGILGTWVVVPAPSGMALVALGGIASGRRRR